LIIDGGKGQLSAALKNGVIWLGKIAIIHLIRTRVNFIWGLVARHLGDKKSETFEVVQQLQMKRIDLNYTS
jgi:hypothetical protein